MKYKLMMLMIIFAALIACEQEIKYSELFKIKAADNGVCICDTSKDIRGTFRIPQTIYGKKVVEIGDNAFSGCREVTEFIIPNTVTTIGKTVFYGCSFKKIFIPKNVKKINEYAFYNCGSLETIDFEDTERWKGTRFYIDSERFITIGTSEPEPPKPNPPKPNPPKPNPPKPNPESTEPKPEHPALDSKTYSIYGVSFNMKQIPAVTDAVIGDNSKNNNKEHTVSLSSYCIGETEVTQELWEAVMGVNPSNFKDSSKNPVERVSWYDCVNFCNELTAAILGHEHRVYKINGNEVTVDFSKQGFRLPTEAEWEYAAMAGKKYKYAGCNEETQLEAYAWYEKNSGDKTHEVGKKKANKYGLYDMSGNVSEWCWDWYSDDTPAGGLNPVGAASGSDRVGRGGCYFLSAWSTERAYRYNYGPGLSFHWLGLRLACGATPNPPEPKSEPPALDSKTYIIYGVSFNMKQIPAVTDAVLGDDSKNDNKEHKVSLSAYCMGETEVTQELWEAVMGVNPSRFKDLGKNPAEQVNWHECIEFCNELTVKVMGEEHCVYDIRGASITADFSKKGFRLPTEAEWEYAAMAGRWHKYAGCNAENRLEGYAWYKTNSSDKTHKVGTRKANKYGLYDMSGNVSEWCWDWYSDDASAGGSDPVGAASGSYRVLRGGCWLYDAEETKRVFRNCNSPGFKGYDLGLRLACGATPNPPEPKSEPPALDNKTYSIYGVSFNMKQIPAVTDAVIGDNSKNNNKEHTVSLSSYCIGETEVTQELWEAVMGVNPSKFKDSSKNPVERVSWYDCVNFCNELTAEIIGEEHCVYTIRGNEVTADFSKQGFRLPTEAEWEYAAMAGKWYKYAGCNSENLLKGYAWYKTNSSDKTHKVGTRKANKYGLYDMSGNVWEWCWDWYSDDTPAGGLDPVGAASGSNRVDRGGGWNDLAEGTGCAYRNYCSPGGSYGDVGLRLACGANPNPPEPKPEEPVLDNKNYSVNGVIFNMKQIPAVTDAVIGDDSKNDNKEHKVSLSAYCMGETEVTQELWEAVMGVNPSRFKDSGKNPAEQVNWHECIEFCNELTVKVMGEEHCVYDIRGASITADFSKKGFRLPTEAEWEYAAMAGRWHKYAGCNLENQLEAYAWYKTNSSDKTHKVGTRKANKYGLYDMSGNVWEWCWDWYSDDTPAGGLDPVGAASGSYRVFRGGSWCDDAAEDKDRAYRGYDNPVNSHFNLGLRLVCRSF